MTNVVAMISEAVMKRLARWLRVGILGGYIGQRMAALVARRVCAAWWTSVGALPPMRQQLTDPAVQLRERKQQAGKLPLRLQFRV